ncbi:HGF [Mytilus edulis]|uniref:HGF n=1 Tax=Mytilus edulis TaxID=6550 RepID=A0A8S3TYB7_MYTED|nr:HGF [Mytilus edulis]
MVFVDDTCLTMHMITPYTNTYGSNVTYRCSSRLYSLQTAEFDFCPVELCTPNNAGNWTDAYLSCAQDECYTSGSSHLYAGKRNCGLSGTTCQAWNQQTPHAHTYISGAHFPDASIDDAKNYCRDPAGSVGEPWCYTTNSSVLREICEIPECSEVPIDYGECADCGPADLQVPFDHPCTEIDPITTPPTTYGTVVNYKCTNLLYMVSPINGFCPVEVCQANGVWTNGSRSCGDKECYDSANGQSMWYEASRSAPLMEHHVCDGILSIMDQTTVEAPTQASSCPIPKLITYSTNSYTGLLPGDTVTYVCDQGYVVTSGDLVRTCDFSGVWNGALPVCTTPLCPSPSIIANTVTEVQGSSPGDKAVYSCIPGFVAVSGDLEHVCTTSLSWEGINPVCIQIVGGQHTDRGYKKTIQDLSNYSQLQQPQARSNLNCAEKCNKDSLCNSYTFDNSVKACRLYKFDMTGSNLVCTGSDICYIRHS